LNAFGWQSSFELCAIYTTGCFQKFGMFGITYLDPAFDIQQGDCNYTLQGPCFEHVMAGLDQRRTCTPEKLITICG
jgi:hypothetical protein